MVSEAVALILTALALECVSGCVRIIKNKIAFYFDSSDSCQISTFPNRRLRSGYEINIGD